MRSRVAQRERQTSFLVNMLTMLLAGVGARSRPRSTARCDALLVILREDCGAPRLQQRDLDHASV